MIDIGFTLARPAALWWLVVVPFVWLVGMTAGIRRQRLARPVPWLRAGAMSLVIVALAEPLLTSGSGASSTVFVVDRSASIDRASAGQAEAWVREAIAAAGGSSRAAVVTFGGSPELAQPGLAAADAGDAWAEVPFPPEQATYTDIESALALARTLPLGGSRRVVLLSDGAENVGEALAQSGQAAAEGLPIDVVPLGGTGQDDLRVDGVTAPAATWQGEPFAVLVSAASGSGGEGSVELWIDGMREQAIPARFAAGISTFQFNVADLAPGFHALEVRVVPTTAPDVVAENNVAPLATVVRGQPAVLMVVPAGHDPERLRLALERRGAAVTVVAPSGVPARLSEIGDYDTVVLNNVPADQLRLDQLAALREATRALGRGLIVLGGTGAYGPGGYAGTTLEETLPVTVKVTEGRQRERVAILLVVDHSGSMSYDPVGGGSKMDMAKQAVVLATNALADGDLVGVLAFDEAQQWVLPITEIVGEATRSDLAARVAALEPGGGTEIYPALSLGFDAIGAVEADARHIVLLTDGKSQTGSRESYQQLLDAAVTQNTTLSTIAIGNDADQELLQFLAETGEGRYHFTDRPEEIPRITLEEARSAGSQSVLRGVFSPIQTGASPIMAGFDPETMPALDGYDFAEAKPNAQVVLASDREDPLLAKWQYGLGRVVAWTGDDGADFSREWVAWPGYDGFWSNVVRWSLPDPEARPLRITAARDGTTTVLSVDALAEDGGFVDQAATTATVTNPTGGVAELTLVQAAPGRYEARVSAPDPGAYRVELRQSRGGETLAEVAGFAVPPSPESRPQPGGHALLRALAALTGGRVLDLSDPGAAFAAGGSSGGALREFRPIWGLPLALALVLILFEIATRMGMLPVLGRWVRWGRRPGPVQ